LQNCPENGATHAHEVAFSGVPPFRQIGTLHVVPVNPVLEQSHRIWPASSDAMPLFKQIEHSVASCPAQSRARQERLSFAYNEHSKKMTRPR
jgi:hypothetical protein